MALGIFNDFEIDEILSIRDTVRDTLLAGGSIVTQWNTDNASMSRVQGMSLTQILLECKHSLRKKDPDVYGRNVRQTKPYYLGPWM